MSQHTMQLVISHHQYTISEAILNAHIIPPTKPRKSANGSLESGLFWYLGLTESSGETNFSIEMQFTDLKRWIDITGKACTWTHATNAATGEFYGTWYYEGGHSEILEASLRIVEREGCRFRIKWEGIGNAASFGCEPDPDQRMSFAIDCWCIFQWVQGLNRELIAQYLDINDFAPESEDEDSYLSLRVLPKLLD